MNSPRKSRRFWAVTETHQVQEVTGWECPQHDPNNATVDHWWCPELGYTLTVGYHLFDDKEAAKAKALNEISEVRIALIEQERTLKLL